MSASEKTNEPEKFSEATIQVHTEGGMVEQRALVHPLVSGLCVTMLHFGFFDVTHVGTGKKLAGPYERVGSACETLAEFGHYARALGFSFTDEPETWREHFVNPPETPVTFPGHVTTDKDGRRPTSWRSWLMVTRSAVLGDEFPWEDESPSDRSWRLLTDLMPEATADA